MNRGDVYWFKFKEPDKPRPALIITRESAIASLNAVTVIPITTTLRDNPSTVWLDESDGMPENCLVNVDNIQTVSKTRIGSFITHLSDQKIGEVFEAVKFAFGFDK
ncbi:MAG TPA: type II toxin-antitoxin system PemK/MazF family toxin [Pyrinomonadaceae bacterium]|nr:type II toxin-antitoxin system PemK/MazF family toxin [Pyrinomonadaceae bacterium]